MNELALKICKLIEHRVGESAYQDHVDLLKKELLLMHKCDVLTQFYKLYNDIKDNRMIAGDKNELNSWAAFAIGITSEPPDLKEPFVLSKRRTYARSGWPDIDMDFDYLRRSEVIDYLKEKYGEEYVANIGTTQSLKTKAAVRRVVKVLDPENTIQYDKNGNKIKTADNRNFMLENKILKTLPELMKRPDGTFVSTVAEAYEEYNHFKEAMDAYPEVYRISQEVENRISGFGCHAGDIVRA